VTFAASAGVWIVGTTFCIILTIILNEPVQSAVVRLGAGFAPRAPRNLTGLWRLEYQYTARGQKNAESQVVELRSFAGAVFGRTIYSQNHRYEIKGRLRQELYFTGYWHSILPGQAYHGSFQLTLHLNGSDMAGKWLGFSEIGHAINHGEWTWKRLSQRVNQRERMDAIKALESEKTR
jgi:hypothetical protein